MKKLLVFMAALILMLEASPPAMSQSGASKAADCSTYARNRAESESASGGGALRGGLRGGAGGALFGAIIGGSKGAKRGAALGGSLGAIGGGIRARENRETRYQYYFDTCMRGEF